MHLPDIREIPYLRILGPQLMCIQAGSKHCRRRFGHQNSRRFVIHAKILDKHYLQDFRKALLLSLVLAFFFGMPVTQVEASKHQLNDVSITDAVQGELLWDPGVQSSWIDVKTERGVVSLSGTVDNILAKERAARIAGAVKGVRSVVNQIRVVPPVLRSDMEIRNDVKDALVIDPATEAYEIGVAAQGNIVTLTGSVDSWQERRLVEKVTKGVKGVIAVDNKIDVDYKTTRLDPEIEHEIEQALRWNPLVDHVLIDVDVGHGKVRLSGTVGSASEKTEALIDAWVTGVRSVDASGLEVKERVRDENLRKSKYVVKSDDEIRKAVENAFLYDPRVSSLDVFVAVSDGDITLRGTVDNLKAKRAASQDARNTVGVRTVKNRIIVRPSATLSDTIIAENLRKALKRDPYVEHYKIDVTVFSGTAYLRGAVDSYFEKSQAEDVASRVGGVVAVRNNLVVEGDYAPPVYDPYLGGAYPHDRQKYGPGSYPLKTDAQIEEDIKDELWWSPLVDAENIKVSVDDGVATLEGKVYWWSEIQSAVADAYQGGAIRVRNELELPVDYY